MPVVLTIGHSNHSLEKFLALLAGAGVEFVADVRAAPVSRRYPHFDKEPLSRALHQAGLSYLFLGRELGGRPSDPALYTGGIADFERMAETSSFRTALQRVLTEAEWLRLALMCTEKDPLDCHRTLLIGRALAAQGVVVQHILADGSILPHEAIEADLAGERDLLTARQDILAAAYRERARRIAFRKV